jgi:hypothetical protein
MPSETFPVSGHLYLEDSVTVCEGGIITAFNNETEEEILTTSTTNSLGEYTLDLANFLSGWTAGDYIVLKATKGNKIQQMGFTISGSYKEQDIILTYHDGLYMIKGILEDNWKPANCDLKTPKIERVFDAKRIDINVLSNKNDIRLYERPTIVESNALGGLTQMITLPIVMDLRGTESREITLMIRNEVNRILNSKLIEPVYGWNLIEPEGEWTDLSDKSRGLWRYTLPVKLVKTNSSRTGEWVIQI